MVKRRKLPGGGSVARRRDCRQEEDCRQEMGLCSKGETVFGRRNCGQEEGAQPSARTRPVIPLMTTEPRVRPSSAWNGYGHFSITASVFFVPGLVIVFIHHLQKTQLQCCAVSSRYPLYVNNIFTSALRCVLRRLESFHHRDRSSQANGWQLIHCETALDFTELPKDYAQGALSSPSEDIRAITVAGQVIDLLTVT